MTPHTPSKTTYASTFPDPRPPAHGLYITQTSRFYPFNALGADLDRERIQIGWSNRCHIGVPESDKIKPVHAEIEYRRNMMYLHDCAHRYDMFVEGWQLVRPIPLLVGMVIVMGDVQMVATDMNGSYQILADTVSDFCRKAYNLNGKYRGAGRKVGRSHNFVRKQFEPRSQRFKGK